MVTTAPSLWKAKAVARPIPESAPVKMAAFPWSLLLPLYYREAGHQFSFKSSVINSSVNRSMRRCLRHTGWARPRWSRPWFKEHVRHQSAIQDHMDSPSSRDGRRTYSSSVCLAIGVMSFSLPGNEVFCFLMFKSSYMFGTTYRNVNQKRKSLLK